MTTGSAARIQPWILPEGMEGEVVKLFFRGRHTLHGDEIRVPANSSADTGTYFNALSVSKWYDNTIIDQLELQVAVAQGVGRLCLWHKSTTHEVVRIGDAVAFNTACTLKATIDLSALRSGLIYWEIVSEDDVRITDACYISRKPRRNEVRTAIVVTNFCRDDEIAHAIQHFRSSALSALGHRLIIVDNGGTLVPGEFSWGWIFENPNVGGAGGFSRGMIEARERGFTHVLLMDDDARTMTQSVERTINLLSWARRQDLAIVGAMLVSELPWLQHEAGAQFREPFGVQALRHAADLRDLRIVLQNESDIRVDYGAWWFFALPLSEVRSLAFPFFVRGDDVQFCQANEFHLITLNGACCWQPRFDDKITPVVEYLTARSELVIAILRASKGWGGIIRVAMAALKTAMSEALEFRYDYANARCDGFDDALRGPDFWERHVSAVPQLKEVQRRYQDQVPRDVSNLLHDIPVSSGAGGNARHKWIRRISLGGHLIPNVLLTDSDLYFPALHSTHGRGFMQRRILYYSPRTRLGFLAKKSTRRFLGVTFRLFRFLITMALCGSRLKRAYETRAPYLQSEAFWRRAMGMPAEGLSLRRPALFRWNPDETVVS